MATSETVVYSNTTFKTYLMKLSADIIWKNSTEAKKYESNCDPYLVEIMVVANRGLLNWDVVRAFPRAILKGIGISTTDMDKCASNKDNIPTALRDVAVTEYAKAFTTTNPSTGRMAYPYTYLSTDDEGNPITVIEYIEIYEEKNDYYRMLNGLPPINDKDFVYSDDNRWDRTIPVHILPLVDRYEMEAEGYLDTLVKKYPTKKYLKYIGSKMIDIYAARSAERFDILWRHTINSTTLSTDFEATYNGCKNLVNSVYYSDAFRKTNTLYENFLAMCLIFMTLQTMQYHYLNIDIIRDFYDTESLKYVYDSYGVPFYNEIPLEYHRKIVKNINRLIGYKGSSKVFFDLFDIFDLSNMNIYSYYLTKQHLCDSEGHPLLDPELDDDGNVILDKYGNPVLKPNNYKINFMRSEIYADPALSASDNSNAVDYTALTMVDPYWVEDADLIKKLEGETFNFTESKYIGVQTVFDLLGIAYDSAYIFKMMTDKKSEISKYTFQWAEGDLSASLVDMFFYLAALYCKYYGYDGEISSKLPIVAQMIGYDFSKSIRTLQNYINNNDYLKTNSRLKEIILNMNPGDSNTVNICYQNIKEIQKMVTTGITSAKNRDEFYAYRDLYDTLLTSQLVEDAYRKSDGTIAESFEDLLASTNGQLYARYLGMEKEDLQSEMSLCIAKIEDEIPSIKNLTLSVGMGTSNMINSLFKILNFFKSAKAELTGYNIIYQITMRGVNFIKFLDSLPVVNNTGIQISENVFQYDFVQNIKYLIHEKEDLLSIGSDRIVRANLQTRYRDTIQRLDDLLVSSILIYEGAIEDGLHQVDYFSILREMVEPLRETIKHYDSLNHWVNHSRLNHSILQLKDTLEEKIGKSYINEIQHLSDRETERSYRGMLYQSARKFADLLITYMDKYELFAKDVRMFDDKFVTFEQYFMYLDQLFMITDALIAVATRGTQFESTTISTDSLTEIKDQYIHSIYYSLSNMSDQLYSFAMNGLPIMKDSRTYSDHLVEIPDTSYLTSEIPEAIDVLLKISTTLSKVESKMNMSDCLYIKDPTSQVYKQIS